MSIHWTGYIILLCLALYPIDSGAIQFSQCLTNVQNCASNSSASNCTLYINISNETAFSILRTSQGGIVTSADDATALSYAGCKQYCGTGVEEFSWMLFSEDYAAWLLPYLALLSQLPFGARRRTDNLISVLLTLGSPALAGYSLFMTLLNSRWVNDRLFAGINYPSSAVRRSVVRVLSSLQQVPLRVHPGEFGKFESLVIHPDNDNWWTVLAEELDHSSKWSIASPTSITWVVIAYLLSVANSINNVADNIDSNGQGTGTGWLWLLPIVAGWLILSLECDHKHVHDAYHKANRQVFVADSEDSHAAPTHVTSNFGLTISPNPDWLHSRDITSPDEARIPPVFNYSRTFSWYRNVYVTSLFFRAAWRKSRDGIGVDGRFVPGNGRGGVPRASRLGTREEIASYCQPDEREYSASKVLWPRGLFHNMVVASLMSLQLQWGTMGAALLVAWYTPTIGLGCRSLAFLLYGALSTIVWMLLVLSSALGYYAHHLIHDLPAPDPERNRGQITPDLHSVPSSYRPTTSQTDVGPGVSQEQTDFSVPMVEIHPSISRGEREDVRLDANSDTSTWFITVKRQLHSRCTYGQMISRIADLLRWIGKLLAIVNAICIIANSILEYAGVYANCFCNSSVYSQGTDSFFIIQPDSNDIDLARRAWIGGLALGLSSCAFFLGSIYIVHDALPR